jgi:hypothetical protein
VYARCLGLLEQHVDIQYVEKGVHTRSIVVVDTRDASPSVSTPPYNYSRSWLLMRHRPVTPVLLLKTRCTNRRTLAGGTRVSRIDLPIHGRSVPVRVPVPGLSLIRIMVCVRCWWRNWLTDTHEEAHGCRCGDWTARSSLTSDGRICTDTPIVRQQFRYYLQLSRMARAPQVHWTDCEQWFSLSPILRHSLQSDCWRCQYRNDWRANMWSKCHCALRLCALCGMGKCADVEQLPTCLMNSLRPRLVYHAVFWKLNGSQPYDFLLI